MTWSPIEAPAITIKGVDPIPRTFHRDPRGFLIETLRSDDDRVNGAHFRMTYASLTVPGEYRDRDRWHVHRYQTDRFVVVLGEMMLALLDGRENSPTSDRLEVIRLRGAPFSTNSPRVADPPMTYLVPIPPGVLHCIGNLSSMPFLLQNFPTELYNPDDEGRVPFADRPISPSGETFAWAGVQSTP